MNIVAVGIPVAILIVGMYLTHSRGAIVALTAILVVSARRKIGTIPAALIAAVLFVVSLAAGWSGGRDVSLDAGVDRLDAWYAGIELIKSHPLLGVGIGRFPDFNNGLTWPRCPQYYCMCCRGRPSWIFSVGPICIYDATKWRASRIRNHAY